MKACPTLPGGLPRPCLSEALVFLKFGRNVLSGDGLDSALQHRCYFNSTKTKGSSDKFRWQSFHVVIQQGPCNRSWRLPTTTFPQLLLQINVPCACCAAEASMFGYSSWYCSELVLLWEWSTQSIHFGLHPIAFKFEVNNLQMLRWKAFESSMRKGVLVGKRVELLFPIHCMAQAKGTGISVLALSIAVSHNYLSSPCLCYEHQQNVGLTH